MFGFIRTANLKLFSSTACSYVAFIKHNLKNRMFSTYIMINKQLLLDFNIYMFTTYILRILHIRFITYLSRRLTWILITTNVRQSLISVKSPALDCLDHEVPAPGPLAPHQGRVVVGGAGLGPPLTQAGVQPQPELTLSRTNSKVATVRVKAASKQLILMVNYSKRIFIQKSSHLTKFEFS